MRDALIGIAGLFLGSAIAATAVIALYDIHARNENVPVTEGPKQSPYSVKIEVCGVVKYILVTTNPPQGVSRGKKPTPEFLAALRSVPPENVLTLKHWDTFCPQKT